MSKETTCNICRKEFAGLEALSQHQKDKHHIKDNIKKGNGKLYLYGFAVLIIIFGIWAVFSAISSSNSCETKDVKELFITSHTKTALHIHSNLEIKVNNKKQEIPANIGVGGNIMRAVHTHDNSGELHIEPPCVRDITLKDFFSIWEKQFNSNCIFDNCDNKSNSNNESVNASLNESKNSLKMFVNGKENNEFENLILRDKQEIVIEYNDRL